MRRARPAKAVIARNRHLQSDLDLAHQSAAGRRHGAVEFSLELARRPPRHADPPRLFHSVARVAAVPAEASTGESWRLSTRASCCSFYGQKQLPCRTEMAITANPPIKEPEQRPPYRVRHLAKRW